MVFHQPHLKNMRQTWIMKPQGSGGEHQKIVFSCHHPENMLFLLSKSHKKKQNQPQKNVLQRQKEPPQLHVFFFPGGTKHDGYL